jgi:hypothetical protein
VTQAEANSPSQLPFVQEGLPPPLRSRQRQEIRLELCHLVPFHLVDVQMLQVVLCHLQPELPSVCFLYEYKFTVPQKNTQELTPEIQPKATT